MTSHQNIGMYSVNSNGQPLLYDNFESTLNSEPDFVGCPIMFNLWLEVFLLGFLKIDLALFSKCEPPHFCPRVAKSKVLQSKIRTE